MKILLIIFGIRYIPSRYLVRLWYKVYENMRSRYTRSSGRCHACLVAGAVNGRGRVGNRYHNPVARPAAATSYFARAQLVFDGRVINLFVREKNWPKFESPIFLNAVFY